VCKCYMYIQTNFLPEVLDILFRDMASWIRSNTKQMKNQNLTTSAWKFMRGHVWIFQQDSGRNTSKAKQKWVTEHKTKQDLNPYRKWVGWTEEKKCHGSGNLNDLERFCMEEWSLISCQVFSKLIRHYKRRLRAVFLEKGGCKYLIKGGK